MKCPFCRNQMKLLRPQNKVYSYHRCYNHKCLVVVSKCGPHQEIVLADHGYEIVSFPDKMEILFHEKRTKKANSRDNMFFYHNGRYYDFSLNIVLTLNDNINITPENFDYKLKTLLTFL